MSTSTADFTPVARGFLDHLELSLMHCHKAGLTHRQRIDTLTRPVMDLKANAGMFRYTLITILANIMLGFLERIPALDNEAREIVNAHHTTLKMIIDTKMTGNGGSTGAILTRELKDACNRYFAKRGMKPLSIAML